MPYPSSLKSNIFSALLQFYGLPKTIELLKIILFLFFQFVSSIIIDPTAEEDPLLSSRLTLCYSAIPSKTIALSNLPTDLQLCGVFKAGGSGIGAVQIAQLQIHAKGLILQRCNVVK